MEDWTIEIWKEGIRLVCEWIKEIDKIWSEHLTLSIATGRPIGIMIREPDTFISPVDICETILNSIY